MTALRRVIGQRQGIGLAAVLLMVSVLGSRALGLARDVVIYGTFGLSPDLDAYFAAIRIPDIIFQLLVGAALASAFIPTFTGLLAKGGEAESWRLANNSVILAALVGGALSLASFLAAPLLITALLPTREADVQALGADLMRILSISPALFGVSTILGAVLNSRRSFLLPALAPWLYNLAIIAGAGLLGPIIGVYGIAIGAVAGAALHLLIQAPGVAAAGMRLSARLDLGDRYLQQVLRLTGPRVLGMAAIYFNWLVTTAIAATLPAGSIAAVTLAWGVMMLPLGLFAMSLAQASFPSLSEHQALDNREQFQRTATRAWRSSLFLVLPSSAGLATIGIYLITVLYQRGEFDQQATLVVASTLTAFAVGLFAHGTLEVLTRVFYATHNTRIPVATALLSVAINLPLSFLLAATIGVTGLALALSIATSVEAIVLVVIAIRSRRLVLDPESRRSLVLMTVFALVTAAVLWGYRSLIGTAASPSQALLPLAGGILLGIVVYGGLSAVTHLPEVDWVTARLSGRLGGRSRRVDPA